MGNRVKYRWSIKKRRKIELELNNNKLKKWSIYIL